MFLYRNLKNSCGFNGIRTHALYDAGAMLYLQLSYETTLHKSVERAALLRQSCFVTQSNKKTEGGLGRDKEETAPDTVTDAFRIPRCTSNGKFRIGPLTVVHRCQIFLTS